MNLEIDLLGRFAVRHDGRKVASDEFGGRLARQLIRVLVIRRGQVVTRDALIDALWDEQAPADPDANLNVLVNRARRGLGEPEVIETVAGGYVFSADADVAVDIERFEAHRQAAGDHMDAGRPDQALRAVRSALDVWRGEPLPEDSYTEWAQPYRDRLERIHQEAIELGAAAALSIADAAQACDLAAQAVAQRPLREVAHLLHIRALAATGDRAGALVAYDVLRHRLAEELGIDPSRAAADLQQRVLRGEPVAARATGPPRAVVSAQPAAAPPFVGRDRELARLTRLDVGWRVALVSGHSGSGKSRLLHEVVTRTGHTALQARAVLPEREAPWALARALILAAVTAGAEPRTVLPARSRAALASALPELTDDDASAAVDPRSRRALVFEGAVQLVTAVGPTLVVVDDLQWADASSLDLLATIAARAGGVRIVLAYRPEEVPADQDVATFLADVRSTSRPLELRLGRLDAAAAEVLVADPALASVLAEATDGTPFAVLEVIRTLEQQGMLRRHGPGWRAVDADVFDRARAEARAGQRRSVLVRADRRSPIQRELLGLLALLGRPAPARLLADAMGMTAPEVDEQMVGLVRTGLVALGDRGWAVDHDLVGETLRDRLDAVDRAGFHQMLARVLARHATAPGERARHLASAGDRPAAAAAYAEAARDRLEHFADAEARRLAEAGLELVPADPIRSELLETRAETRARTGSLSDARDDLRRALSLVTAGPDRSRLLARLATLASGAEDLLRASNLADLALADAADDPRARARALAVAAIVDMNLERPQRAQSRYSEALALFERVGDARGVADVLDARAMATFLDGDIAAAIAAFDRVARLFTDIGDLLRVVTPRSTRGHGLVFAGAPQDGLADADEALELTRSLGHPEGEAYACWHRSEALTACGRHADAAAAAAEALAVADRLGHRGWTATALRATGVAHQASGDLDLAEDAFRRSLAASEHLPLFACWAHARLGLVLIATDRPDESAGHIQRSLVSGPPLGHYEARLAHCELAVARAAPDALALVADATERAIRGGHRASLTRLSALRDTAGA